MNGKHCSLYKSGESPRERGLEALWYRSGSPKVPVLNPKNLVCSILRPIPPLFCLLLSTLWNLMLARGDRGGDRPLYRQGLSLVDRQIKPKRCPDAYFTHQIHLALVLFHDVAHNRQPQPCAL